MRTAYHLLQPLLRAAQATPAECARSTVICVAHGPEAAAELKGQYLERAVPVPPAAAALDDAISLAIWQMSLRLIAPWCPANAGARPDAKRAPSPAKAKPNGQRE